MLNIVIKRVLRTKYKCYRDKNMEQAVKPAPDLRLKMTVVNKFLRLSYLVCSAKLL